MSNIDTQSSILTTKSSNLLNYKNGNVYNYWKYYKLYDESIIKNNFSMVSDSKSINNNMKYVKSSRYIIYSNNKLINIFDTKSNSFAVSNINIDDFDVSKHEITHLKITETITEGISDSDIFVTVVFEKSQSENNINSPYIIKIYNLSDILQNVSVHNTSNNTLKYHTMITVNDMSGKNKFPVSCFEISNNLNVALLGLGNGAVYLIRGDFKRDRGYKQRLIYKNLSHQMITNLRLVNNDKYVVMSTIDLLLILSTDGVINDKQHLEKNFYKNISNIEGANFNLLDVDEKQNLMYVLNVDIVDVYDLANDFNKIDSLTVNISNKSVNNLYLKCINESELIIVTQTNLDDKTLINETSNNRNTVKATIIDVNNHITTLTTVLNNKVNEIIPTINGLLVILKSGTIHNFAKKDINKTVDLILNGSNISDVDYKLAIKLLSNSPVENNEAVIKKYGDFLYNENRLDEAMEQYMKCIEYFMNYSNIENLTSMKPGESSETFPSITDIVIKYAMDNNKENFINSKQNFESLVKFLKTLIMKSFTAKSDYTTLLMILLIKMASWDELLDLVNDISRNGNYSSQPEKARGINNYKDYLYTIQQDEDYWYDDKKIFDVDTITDLLIDSAEMYNGEYSGEVKDILFKLTVKFNKNPEKIVGILLNYLNKEDFALKWIRRLDSIGFLNVIFGSSGVGRILLDLQEKTPKFDILDLYVKLFTGEYKQLFLDGTELKQIYEPPKPSIVFSYFFQKDDLFKEFLEQVINSETIKNEQEFQKCVNALYATYQNLDMKEKASALLSKHKNYVSKLLQKDESLATDDEEAVINNYITLNDINGLIKVTETDEKLQNIQKYTFTRLLRHVTSKPSILNDFTEERLKNLINYILNNKILDMVNLLNVLSETNVASFGIIKNVFIEWLSQQEVTLEQQEEKITKIVEVNNNKNPTCLVCELPLEKDFLKFACGHNVHRACLADDTDIMCPDCGGKLLQYEEEIKTFNSFSKEKDNEIENKMKNSTNSDTNEVFDVLLELLGNGALEIE